MPRPTPPPEPELHRAARTGDIAVLKRLHAQGVDMNASADLEVDNGPQLRGLTPLMVAARSIDGASIETLKWLLDHGADLHARSEGGNTAAWYAAGKGGRWFFHEWRIVPDHVDRLRFLLDAGLDPLEKSFIGRSLLTEACGAGDPARVKLLLARGAIAMPQFDRTEAAKRHQSEIAYWQAYYLKEGASEKVAHRRAEQMSEKPATTLSACEIPLLQASESGSAECVRLILSQGADPNTRDKNGWTALMLAGSAEVVQELIRAGADPLIRDHCGFDALNEVLSGSDCQGACGPARFEVARALIDSGVSIERGPRGNTRLYDAAFSHAENAVEYLLKLGADPLAGEEGVTSLHGICWQGEYEDEGVNIAAASIIERLIAAGVNPNVRDEQGQTPMHDAVFGDWGNPTAVRTLLKHGADADPVDNSSTTPLMLAAFNGELECIRLLLDAGADPMRKDGEGKTAIDIAKDFLNTWRSIAGSKEPTLALIYEDDLLPDEIESDRDTKTETLQKASECLRILEAAADNSRSS